MNDCDSQNRLPQSLIDIILLDYNNCSKEWSNFNTQYKKRKHLEQFSNRNNFDIEKDNNSFLCSSDVPEIPQPSDFPIK